MKIVRADVHDLRFPTSRGLHGSDAMNPDPDYSAAYVVLHAGEGRGGEGWEGHGLAFTIGRGNEVVCAGIQALLPRVLGLELAAMCEDMAGFWRHVTGDSQLRWLGPDKGVMHLAAAAVINAVWDLRAKVAGVPLWRLLVDLSPADVVGVIDFRHLTDALTPEEAREMLERQAPFKEERQARLLAEGMRAYTTSVGWLGYGDAEIRRRCREGLAEGWRHFKLKVGRDLMDDLRRAALVREEIGPDCRLMFDANQVWDVPQAVSWMAELRRFDPWWIEEPTNPDDVLGHAAIARAIHPLRVATGEHCANAVLFKQFLAAGAMQVCQIDACRVAGVNECLAILLLAAKAGVPVCPHAGGVGLCEHVQHLSAFDAIAVSGPRDDRVIEYVDQLHEHFVDPVQIRAGCYRLPEAAGYSTAIRPESRVAHTYPDGPAWRCP